LLSDKVDRSQLMSNQRVKVQLLDQQQVRPYRCMYQKLHEKSESENRVPLDNFPRVDFDLVLDDRMDEFVHKLDKGDSESLCSPAQVSQVNGILRSSGNTTSMVHDRVPS
jgi:hypothetical protein